MPAPDPDGPALLERERLSRRQGSGLTAEQLIGSWVLVQTWPKRREAAPAAVSSAVLRALQARLDLGEAMTIRNSVRLGALELSFSGQARLEGRRPLLVFRFEQMQLRLGTWTLLRRTLSQPTVTGTSPVRDLPFFALIAADQEAGWLAARGRGGGLALWRRQEHVPG
jgi:hypothetical protein